MMDAGNVVYVIVVIAICAGATVFLRRRRPTRCPTCGSTVFRKVGREVASSANGVRMIVYDQLRCDNGHKWAIKP